MISREQLRKIIAHHAHALGTRDIASVTSRHLGTGENNLNLLVTINMRRKVVLRICLREEKWKRMHDEYTMMRLVPPGVGARVFVFDDNRTLIPQPFFILEHIPGRHRFHWGRAELRAFAHLLARLHRVGKPPHSYDPVDIVDMSEKHLRTYPKIVRDPRIRTYLPAMRKYIRAHKDLFAQLRRWTLIHGDACVNNIVWTKGTPKLIDWEHSQIHDPAQDLARIYYPLRGFLPWTIGLTEGQVAYFVDEYLSHSPQDPTLKERVMFWNTYDLFFDLFYCVYRLKNPSKERRGLPKREYLRCIRLLERHLDLRFCTNH